MDNTSALPVVRVFISKIFLHQVNYRRYNFWKRNATDGVGGIHLLTALNSNNSTTLTLINVTVDNNSSTNAGVGGVSNEITGTSSTGTLEVNNSIITNNDSPTIGGIL